LGHHSIDVSPDGKSVYVSGIGFDKVNVIDVPKLEIIKQITVGKWPHGIRTSTDGKLLFVDISSANKIAIIDTNTLEIIKQISTGNTPFWLAVPGNH